MVAGLRTGEKGVLQRGGKDGQVVEEYVAWDLSFTTLRSALERLRGSRAEDTA